MPTKEAPLVKATGRRLPKGPRGGVELLLVHNVDCLVPKFQPEFLVVNWTSF